MNPIFIHAIQPRSGTHFLHDLLCAHPDCVPSSVPEDYMLDQIHLLQHFADGLQRRWRKEWHIIASPLYPELGDALVRFLGGTPGGKRLVTKTPSVMNLDHFFRYFPAGRLIILVRDGRAVAQSTFKSYDTPHAVTIRAWNRAAATILNFEPRAQAASQSYLMVRYEALIVDRRATLERILSFLDLDASKYDFEHAEYLLVRGSSQVRTSPEQTVHWIPVEIPDFQPLLRWQHWPRRLHERFNWIAGRNAQQLGYTLKQFQASPAARLYWRLWNHAHDAVWWARTLADGGRRLPGFVYRSVRQRLQSPI